MITSEKAKILSHVNNSSDYHLEELSRKIELYSKQGYHQVAYYDVPKTSVELDKTFSKKVKKAGFKITKIKTGFFNSNNMNGYYVSW
jgi:hypothetical protein